ncbi:uncharacterized protein UBRO2_04847 [Ustilago bromivora]|nr:uncharacterized protein UBRO2_04847 [Ustilago bromivora]
MRVRGRSSRQQPWWLFVIALSYVLILTFSSAAPHPLAGATLEKEDLYPTPKSITNHVSPAEQTRLSHEETVEAARVKAATGRALQQSNPELSAVKNAHPEVYKNLAKARLRKRNPPKEYMTVAYPGEKFYITRLNGVYMFHFLNHDRSGVMQTKKWSQLPGKMKEKYSFLKGAAASDDTHLQQHGIKITEDIRDLSHIYENPMMPAQRILVLRHEDGSLKFEYRDADGTTRRVPSHQLPSQIQNYVEEIPEIGSILGEAANSSRAFRVRK